MIIVYDLETTGLNIKTAQILELAFIDFYEKQFLSYILPPGITEICNSNIHNITIDTIMNGGGKGTKQVLTELVTWLNDFQTDIVLISHNNFMYDKLILEREFKDHDIIFPNFCNFADTLPICKKVIPNLKSYKLCEIYKFLFGNDIEGQHSAIGDSLALKKILNIVLFTEDISKYFYIEHSSFYFNINTSRLYYFRFKSTKNFIKESLNTKNKLGSFQFSHLFNMKFGIDDSVMTDEVKQQILLHLQ